MLLSPWLKRVGAPAGLTDFVKDYIEPNREMLGFIDLGLGAVSLANRMGLFYVSFLPGGYPQSLVLLGVGLTISYHTLKNIPLLYNLMKKIEPYQEYVGGIGIIFGLHAIF